MHTVIRFLIICNEFGSSSELLTTSRTLGTDSGQTTNQGPTAQISRKDLPDLEGSERK